MLTPEDLKIRYPVFAPLEDQVIQEVINEVAQEISESSWGKHFDRACRLLVAHTLVLEDALEDGESTASPRRLSSRSLGDAAESYANPTNQLQETVYGRSYLRLSRRVLPHAVTV